MPVKVQWDDEAKTIIRQIYEGDIILDDYYIATNEFVKLATSVPHTIHSIMDRTKVRKNSGSTLRVMQYANNRLPPNMGLSIIVKANLITRMMVDMGKKFAPKLTSGVMYCDTLEEARQIIASHVAKTG